VLRDGELDLRTLPRTTPGETLWPRRRS
jgi:hypothetical protein